MKEEKVMGSPVKEVEMHEQKSKMQRVAYVMYWIFAVLTFIGITFALINQGRAGAGYAVIPALFAIIAMSIYRKKTK